MTTPDILIDFNVELPKTYVAQPANNTFSIMPLIVGKSARQRIPLPHGVCQVMLSSTLNSVVQVYHAPTNEGSYLAARIPVCENPNEPVVRTLSLWGAPTGGGFHLSTTAVVGQELKDAHTVQVTVISQLPG